MSPFKSLCLAVALGEGLLVPGWAPPEKDPVFIDIAFAVTPYLLYAGLADNRDDYVNLAVFETRELFRILRDARTISVRQGRGFQGRGVIADDNWSRGNGWGAVGLAALVRDLPATHPRRKEVETLAKDFFAAMLRHQNKDGLWHQETTNVTSYTHRLPLSGAGDQGGLQESRSWAHNDPHAFGAVVPAYAQAARMGIHSTLEFEPRTIVPPCLCGFPV